MHTAPTVIVLATAPTHRAATAPAEGASAWLFHGLLTQLARATDSGLPVALVASSATLEAVRQALPQSRITHSPLDNPMPGGGLAEALRAGVQTCATSLGWIMLPAHLPMLQPATLREMGTLLHLHPVVYASHQSQPGMPIGFGQELFSELMRAASDRELQRLINRYPSRAVEVDGPGVLMAAEQEPPHLVPTTSTDRLASRAPR
jgi:molybdenum cofactor cytidylyltransferase